MQFLRILPIIESRDIDAIADGFAKKPFDENFASHMHKFQWSPTNLEDMLIIITTNKSNHPEPDFVTIIRRGQLGTGEQKVNCLRLLDFDGSFCYHRWAVGGRAVLRFRFHRSILLVKPNPLKPNPARIFAFMEFMETYI
jgi:uncharacterized protein with WD repeat